MNLSAVLRPFLGPPDPRSADQVAADLDDEFAFHIAQIEREILECEPAMSSAETSKRARERFGDVRSIKKRCCRIAMEERIMLQRINTALMAVVVLAVVGVSVQMYLTQRHNTLALQDITTQIASMRVDAEASSRVRPVGEFRPAEMSEVVHLRYADAGAAAEAMAARFAEGAGGSVPAFVVDPRTNALLVRAAPEQWGDIVEAIKDYDLDAAGARGG